MIRYTIDLVVSILSANRYDHIISTKEAHIIFNVKTIRGNGRDKDRLSFFCDIWVTGISFLSFCRYSRSKDNNILAKLMCQCYQINLRWGKNFIYIPPGAKICTLLGLVFYENFYLSHVMCYFYMLTLFVILSEY